MSKFLYTLFFVVFRVYGVTEGMQVDEGKFDWREAERVVGLNWANIADRTCPVDDISMSKMARRQLEGDISIDWNIILEDAIAGDPVAQYSLAVQYNLDSKLAYNGHRKNLQIASAILVFISAQKGQYSRAKSDIDKYMPNLPKLNFAEKTVLLEFVEQFTKALETR